MGIAGFLDLLGLRSLHEFLDWALLPTDPSLEMLRVARPYLTYV